MHWVGKFIEKMFKARGYCSGVSYIDNFDVYKSTGTINGNKYITSMTL